MGEESDEAMNPKMLSLLTTFKRIQATHVRKGLFRPIILCLVPLLYCCPSPLFLGIGIDADVPIWQVSLHDRL